MVGIRHKHQAWVVRGNMCRFGMVTDKAGVSGLSCEPIEFMTNSICVADQLDRRCLNTMTGQRDNDHVQLDGCRPRQAQKYPPELCSAICLGILDQLHLNNNELCMFERLDPAASIANSDNIGRLPRKIHKLEAAQAVPGEEDVLEDLEAYNMET